MRSLLFVPGDSERKLEKAVDSEADALILDLEDSVAEDRKAEARSIVSEFVRTAVEREKRPRLLLRVNPLDSVHCAEDVALADAGLDGLVLPKAAGGRDVATLVAMQTARSVPPLPVVPIATETPAAIFSLSTYGEVADRLAGLSWGAEDLSAVVGSSAMRDENGDWTSPYAMVRNLALMAAAAAGCPAIDTVSVALKNPEGFEAECRRARRDGFAAKLAIHPVQIATINTVFSPSEAEIEHARRIVAHFEGTTVGVAAMDGQMIDRPHYLKARRLLASGLPSATR